MKTRPPRKQKQDSIKFGLKFSAGFGGFMAPGTQETITIEILDGFAFYHFLDAKHTRALNLQQLKDGLKSAYNERLKKTVVKFEGMSKDEIMLKIKEDLLELGVKERALPADFKDIEKQIEKEVKNE